VRRGQAVIHTETLFNGGMWLVKRGDTFCWNHDSLRERAPEGARRKWDARTPAIAVELTDHQWTMGEPIPPLSASTTARAAWRSRGMATRMPATRRMDEIQACFFPIGSAIQRDDCLHLLVVTTLGMN